MSCREENERNFFVRLRDFSERYKENLKTDLETYKTNLTLERFEENAKALVRERETTCEQSWTILVSP